MRHDGGPKLNNAAESGRLRLISATSLLGVLLCLGTVFCGWRIYAGFQQRRLDQQLIVAIENRKEDTAISLIGKGASPNARDEANWAALTFKEMLLAVFGRLNMPSKQGASAIVMAFNRSEMKVAKALILRGAQIGDGRDFSGNSFIIHAIWIGDLEMVRMLVQKDPKIVNVTDNDGDGVVAAAAAQGQWEILQLLLDRGADALVYSKDTHSALYRAIEGGAPLQITQRLINLTAKWMDKAELAACLNEAVDKGKIDVASVLFSMGARIKYRQGAFPSMISAAVDGDVSKMKVLLSFGAEINVQDRMGSPILIAAGHGQLNAVKFLIEHGASVDRCDYTHSNALTDSISEYPKIAELLLQHGANVNHRDRWDETPLMNAAYAGSVDSVKLLLKFGADVNCVNGREECSALMIAAEHGKFEVVRILLAHGAKYGLVGRRSEDNRDYRAITALSLAIENHHNDVARLLKQAGARK